MTTLPATRCLLAPYQINDPAVGKQHWHRPSEALILSDLQAYYALTTANVAGWEPLGTDAAAFRPNGDPFDTTLTAEGTYQPAIDQHVADDDARAIARACPAAIELLRGVSPPHAGPSVLDERLYSRLSLRGSPVYVLGPAKAFDLDKPNGVLEAVADFASRGGFRITAGLPPRAW